MGQKPMSWLPVPSGLPKNYIIVNEGLSIEK